MADLRFSDKVAVITGAAGGFGEGIARRFAAEGAAVVIADVQAKGQGVADDIESAGGRACFAQTDVSSSSDMQRLFEQASDSYGGVDVIVNNAGFSHRMMPMAELSEEDYDRVFAVNTKSVFLSVKHGVEQLRARGGGAIVNIASIGAMSPRPMVTAYNATKGAVVTMTRGLAVELAPDDIRVNAVNPVAADTDFMRGVYGGDPLPERGREALLRTIPLGRLTLPEDVASAVLFLASDEASFLTGVCLPVDGGRSIS